MRPLALILGLLMALVIAQQDEEPKEKREKKNGGKGNQKKKCGTQTVAGSKCLGLCLQTAQICVLQVGDDINDLQECVQDDETEKTDDCRKCIDELKANDCDEFFNELQAQGQDKNENDKLTPGAFKQLCDRIKDKKECVNSGCYMNKRGCNAKLKKTNCNRVQTVKMCEVIPGCSTRKIQKDKKKNVNKRKICKGKVDWAETG